MLNPLQFKTGCWIKEQGNFCIREQYTDPVTGIKYSAVTQNSIVYLKYRVSDIMKKIIFSISFLGWITTQTTVVKCQGNRSYFFKYTLNRDNTIEIQTSFFRWIIQSLLGIDIVYICILKLKHLFANTFHLGRQHFSSGWENFSFKW